MATGNRTLQEQSAVAKQHYAQTISRASNQLATRAALYQQHLNNHLHQFQDQRGLVYGPQMAPQPQPAPLALQEFFKDNQQLAASYQPDKKLSAKKLSATLRAPSARERASLVAYMQQRPLVYGGPPPPPPNPQLAHYFGGPYSLVEQQARLAASKPLCRCRVMYLGSSVPHITKNGLHGIQEPLRQLYPDEQFGCQVGGGDKSSVQTSNTISNKRRQQQQANSTTIDISHLSSSLGIDSWLSVWSNGLLLENVDEFGREMRRFFSIESLHYCAAVRFFDTQTLADAPSGADGDGDAAPAKAAAQTNDANNNLAEPPPDGAADQQSNLEKPRREGGGGADSEQAGAEAQQQPQSPQPPPRQSSSSSSARFLPLDAPIFQCPGMLDASHPPMFAAIMRRTSGIKVLECHAFICRRDAASNALVRCCTHAYADFLSAKRLSADLGQPVGPAAAATGVAGHQPSHYLNQFRNSYMMPPSGSPANSLAIGSSLTLGCRRTRNSAAQSKAAATVHPQQQRASSAGPPKRRAQPLGRGHAPNSMAAAQSNGLLAQKPLPLSSSSAANTSNETDTDRSSDDNYAVISSSSRHSNLQQQNQQPEQHQQRVLGGQLSGSAARHFESGARQRRGRRTKGSSKSLFDDFMPKPIKPPAAPQEFGGENEKRLSHSLDHLQFYGNGGGDSRRQRLACEDPTCATDPAAVHYSIVKRHSKSMQNLGGVMYDELTVSGGDDENNNYEAIGSRGSRQAHENQLNGDSRRRRKRSANGVASRRESGNEKRNQLAAEGRRANSCQDMRLARKGASANHVRSQQQACEASQQRRRRHADGADATSRAAQDGAPMPEHCNENRKSSASSSKSLARRKHNKLGQQVEMGHHHHQQLYAEPSERQPICAGVLNSGAVHPAHLGQNAAAGHYYYRPVYHHPSPQAPVPYYMPMSPIYAHTPAPATNGVPPIYDSLGYAAPATAAPYNPYTAAAAAAMARVHPLGAATIATGRSSRSAAKSSSSLARFRCLSPPLNLLSGGGNGTTSRRKAKRQSAETNLAAPSLGEPAACGDGGAASLPVEAAAVAGAEIVSGAPVFVAASGGCAAAAAAASPPQKKLSWIKRLSLTLSSAPLPPPTAANANNSNGGQDAIVSSSPEPAETRHRHMLDPAASQPPAGDAAAEPKEAATDAAAANDKRRRSKGGFFAGSLTLGRRAKQQSAARPITSPSAG